MVIVPTAVKVLLSELHELFVPDAKNVPDRTVEFWATSGGTQAMHPSTITCIASHTGLSLKDPIGQPIQKIHITLKRQYAETPAVLVIPVAAY
jgi:hypothetical protein